MKKSAYVVWNADKSEGFVTDDYDDAWQASTGHFNTIRSSLGEAFHEAYEDEIEESGEAREIEEIEVESPTEEAGSAEQAPASNSEEAA